MGRLTPKILMSMTPSETTLVAHFLDVGLPLTASYASLADDTGLAMRTVMAAVRRLQHRGAITVTRSDGLTPNRYEWGDPIPW